MSSSLPTDAQSKYEKCGQGHIFQFWGSLSQGEQEMLLQDVSLFNPEELASIFRASIEHDESLKRGPTESLDNLLPPSNITTLTSLAESGHRDLLFRRGLELIAQGRVAALCLAGGQGTRLGFAKPKGMYDIGLPSHKSLFQIQAEKILRLQELAANHTKTDPSAIHLPWYIMTSEHTHFDTRTYFTENQFFGLCPDQVFFFQQSSMPCFSSDGKILMETKCSIAKSPNGNGGLYQALSASGALSDMERRGIEHVHVYCVDNVLVKIADPVFTALCEEKKAPCGSKVVEKETPSERIGLFVRSEDRTRVVEYTEVPRHLLDQVDPTGRSGKLALRAGNIANHYFSISFLRSACETAAKLPYHVARKKVSHVNSEGHIVEDPRAVKLESFIFDTFPWASDHCLLEVPRSSEFAPLKNGPTDPTDSPVSARAMVTKLHSDWIKNAGGMITTEGDGHSENLVEVCSRLSYDGEDLEALVSARTFAAPLHLDKASRRVEKENKEKRD